MFVFKGTMVASLQAPISHSEAHSVRDCGVHLRYFGPEKLEFAAVATEHGSTPGG
jgi:hypothetical protein